MDDGKRIFFRKARKLGNSAGVLLPKSLLGADVKVSVINLPVNVKKDSMRILEPFLEELVGVYIIKSESRKSEILAVSVKLRKHIEKGDYKIDIVPIEILKKYIKEKFQIREKIAKAKPILNSRLLAELKKESG